MYIEIVVSPSDEVVFAHSVAGKEFNGGYYGIYIYIFIVIRNQTSDVIWHTKNVSGVEDTLLPALAQEWFTESNRG